MALSDIRRTTKQDGGAIPHKQSVPVAATTSLFQGGMVCEDANGRLNPAADTAGLSRVRGVMRKNALNTVAAGFGGAGDINGEYDVGAFWFTNNGSSIAASDRFDVCYAIDDEAVNLTGSGNRPIAGLILDVDASLGVLVLIGAYLNFGDSAGGAGGAAGSGPNFHARGASTADVANLASFTVANDGITFIEGERVFLKNQGTGAENGIYVCGVVGAGTCALTRALDMDSNDELVAGTTVIVAEGTAGAPNGIPTAWVTSTVDAITIGTTATVWVPTAFGFAIASGLAETGSAAAAGTAFTSARADHVHKEHDRSVTYVMTTDVPNLAAFVLLQDGVTGIEGEFVLLANQTTVAENGVYVIGTVAGTAPLARAAWMPTAAILRGGFSVYSEEGTLFSHTTWFIDTAGAITIGTTAHTWFPEKVTFALAIPPGTGTITWADIPILSATKTQFAFINQAEVTADLTVRYGLNGAATAGVVGTCTATMIAEIAAGTVNVDDDSTMLVSVINR